MHEIELVHLVWKPSGMEPFRNFVRAYREHPAGIEHGLVVLYKDFGRDDVQDHRELLADIPHRELRFPGSARDLAAYVWSAQRSDARYLCFVNSYSAPLAAGWLRTLHQHVSRPLVGAVSATGSWESKYTGYIMRMQVVGRPTSPIGWALRLNRLRKLRRYRTQFNPAPNPHLRSNAFMIERSRWLSLRTGPLRTKAQTWLLESGKRGLTPQLMAAGLEVLVVGRDGVGYTQDGWPQSATFRSGNQENLLVADNRTRQYDEADDATRKLLRLLAWGDR